MIIREKYSGGPNFRATSARGGATSMRPTTLMVPADEGPHGRDAQGRARSSLAGHLVSVQTGHHRGGFAGDIEKDGSRGAAIHGPIVDPRQHDDRATGLTL